MSDESNIVAPIVQISYSEVVARLERNTLEWNAVRETLKDLRRDLDFPHNNQKLLADADKSIAARQAELATAIESRNKLAERTSVDRLESQLAKKYDELELIIATRNDLQAQLKTAATLKQAQPTLNKLEKISAQILSLPQAELAALLLSLQASVKETEKDDTNDAATTADADSGRTG